MSTPTPTPTPTPSPTPSPPPSHDSSTPPLYGLQSYWEGRYERCIADDDGTSNDKKLLSATDAVSPQPGFSWYFDYAELKPLLLPLVNKEHLPSRAILEIGCGDMPLGPDLALDLEAIQGVGRNAKEDFSVICTDYSTNAINFLKKRQQKEQEEKLQPSPLDEENATVIKMVEATNNEKRKIHPNKKRKMQPLFEQEGGKNNQMAQAHHKPCSMEKTRVEFRVADATDMPFADKQFLLVIDKGTLDAVLSDKDNGAQMCISIVKEAARLVAVGGAFVVVSHMNANNRAGRNWLNDVIIAGLAGEDCDTSWEIEIHGQEGEGDESDGGEDDEDDVADVDNVSDADDDVDEEGEDEKEEEVADKKDMVDASNKDQICGNNANDGVQESARCNNSEQNENEGLASIGPAVYIIRKKLLRRQSGSLSEDEGAVTLTFFSY